MKIKRNKKAAKIIKLLTQNLGYRLPLQIVADGTFFKAATDNQMCKDYDPKLKGEFDDDPLVTAIHKYLQVSFNVFTTISVMNELSMLGPDFRKAARLAKQYKLFPTEFSSTKREQLPPASVCLSKIIKRSAAGEHFIIASNDPTLRHKARLDKIPYMYIHKNALIIEGVQTGQVNTVRTNVQEQQLAKARQIKDALGLDDTTASKNVYTRKHRKKRAKGANPLSVKRGKVGKATQGRSGGEKAVKKRKRSKGGNQGKEKRLVSKSE